MGGTDFKWGCRAPLATQLATALYLGLCECIACANCVKRKIANRKAAIIHHNNAVDCKRNENAVVGVRRLNFLMLNKSVTTEVRKVAVELAVSLCCSNC